MQRKKIPGIKGLNQLETGRFSNPTDDQVATLAEVPILVVVGDYLGNDPEAACLEQMEQIQEAGGDMTFISHPDVGISGNGHMFMQDKNNLQVADVFVTWVNEHVEKKE